MRKFLASVILLASLAGGGVFGYWLVDKNTAAANLGKAAYTAEHDWSYLDVWRYEQKQPIYIFLYGSFMGKYEDGAWYSLSDVYGKEREIFYLKDLVVMQPLKQYDMEQFYGETTTIGWYVDNGGLGSFGFDSDTEYTLEQQKALMALTGKTQEELDNRDDVGYIELPNRIRNKALRKLSIPYYNAGVFWSERQEGQEETSNGILALNAEHDPHPQSVKQGGELPEEYRAYFLELFKREGMPDAPLVVSEYCQSDMDGDGENESIIILQNTEEKKMNFYQAARGKKKYGLYTYVFYIDGERVQTLYKNTMPCTGDEAAASRIDVTALVEASLLGVYDLNGDGKLECCVDIGAWEWGWTSVYALNADNEYEEVLCSDNGT